MENETEWGMEWKLNGKELNRMENGNGMEMEMEWKWKGMAGVLGLGLEQAQKVMGADCPWRLLQCPDSISGMMHSQEFLPFV